MAEQDDAEQAAERLEAALARIARHVDAAATRRNEPDPALRQKLDQLIERLRAALET